MMTEHLYGPQVKLIQSPFHSAILAKLCHPDTFQPQINHLTRILYNYLCIRSLESVLQLEEIETPTRMSTLYPEQRLKYRQFLPGQKVVTVNLARAGTLPSQICFEVLHEVLPHQNIRQDHIFASRVVNAKGQVTGTDLGNSKVGGDVIDRVVFFPDPMGATGGTLSSTISYYKTKVPGPAHKYVAINLIVTPEYIRRIVTEHPDVQIFALRLDRGLSPQAVLNSVPGAQWDQEKGLTDNQYIVPGGGGFGEIMNNSFV